MKWDKSKSCKHQCHEGIFVSEKDKYIVSFFFDDKGLKLSLLKYYLFAFSSFLKERPVWNSKKFEFFL